MRRKRNGKNIRINRSSFVPYFEISNGIMEASVLLYHAYSSSSCLSLEEGEIRDGRWHMRRRLNGDEVASMRYDKPTLLKIKGLFQPLLHIYDKAAVHITGASASFDSGSRPISKQRNPCSVFGDIDRSVPCAGNCFDFR